MNNKDTGWWADESAGMAFFEWEGHPTEAGVFSDVGFIEKALRLEKGANFPSIKQALRKISFDGIATLEIVPAQHGGDGSEAAWRCIESLCFWKSLENAEGTFLTILRETPQGIVTLLEREHARGECGLQNYEEA